MKITESASRQKDWLNSFALRSAIEEKDKGLYKQQWRDTTMKKMRSNLLKRILTFALALCMGVSMTSVSAFAAETEGVTDSSDYHTTRSGEVITSGMATVVDSTTITLNLSKVHWSVDIYVGVLGNTGARYEVVLTEPDGTQYTSYITGGPNNISLFSSMVYSQTGNYKFKFTRLSGSSIAASAIVEFQD